jgi:hypothetical protein
MSPDWPSSRAAALWWLGAICLLGGGLRFYGLAYGLPDVHNPDEIPILSRALALAKGDPNPHNFLYPSLYFYALFLWEGLFFAAGRLMGLYGSVAAFQREFFIDPSRLVLAGRALTATFGVLAIPAVYRFGARLYGRLTGLGAALFLAVSPFAVRDSHYVKLDVPTSLFVALTFAVLARIVVDPESAARRRTWLLAGALSGLAMSTHYYAIFIVVPFFVAMAADVTRSRSWRASFTLLVWAGVASVVAFFAASPFMLVEPQTVVRDLVGVRQVDIDRAVAGSRVFSTLVPYLRMLGTDALGWLVGGTGAVGLLLATIADWRRGALMLSFALAFLAFCANTVPQSRYLNVVLPVFAVGAAFAVTKLPRRSFFEKRKSTSEVVFCGLLAAVALPGLLLSIRSDQFFRQADTRTLARQFIEREVPSGSSVLIQPHGVQLRPSREGLIEALRANLGSESRATIKYQLQLQVDPYPAPAYRTIYLGEKGEDADKIYISPRRFDDRRGLSPLREGDVRYVVLKRYNDPDPAVASLQAALEREGHLIATFSPYRADASPDRRATVVPFFHNTAARIDPALERPGPIIDIWRIN